MADIPLVALQIDKPWHVPPCVNAVLALRLGSLWVQAKKVIGRERAECRGCRAGGTLAIINRISRSQMEIGGGVRSHRCLEDELDVVGAANCHALCGKDSRGDYHVISGRSAFEWTTLRKFELQVAKRKTSRQMACVSSSLAWLAGVDCFGDRHYYRHSPFPLHLGRLPCQVGDSDKYSGSLQL